jgi:hypothetical protein
MPLEKDHSSVGNKYEVHWLYACANGNRQTKIYR